MFDLKDLIFHHKAHKTASLPKQHAWLEVADVGFGFFADENVSTWSSMAIQLEVLTRGEWAIFNCTRPCTKAARWCKKNSSVVLNLSARPTYFHEVLPDEESAGKCVHPLNIMAVEEINGDTFYCASSCSQFLCSHMVPFVIHVQGASCIHFLTL